VQAAGQHLLQASVNIVCPMGLIDELVSCLTDFNDWPDDQLSDCGTNWLAGTLGRCLTGCLDTLLSGV
jgi:hypothetical protein